MSSDEPSGERWDNEKNPARYMAAIAQSGHAVIARETIDQDKAAGEFLFLGLRMTEGVLIDAFRSRFKKTPVESYPRIASWIEGQLMEENGGYLRLSPKGALLANSIFVEFM
jgi:oxygen-independent coproporphyrinogen-3 oxidase